MSQATAKAQVPKTKRVPFVARFSPTSYRKLKKLAQRQEIAIAEAVRDAVDFWLAYNERSTEKAGAA